VTITTGFTFEPMPTRVVFGRGALAQLGAAVDGAGLSRVLVLSTPEQRALAEDIAVALGTRSVAVHPHATMHVPVEVVTVAADRAAKLGVDGCVAVGGGSTIGLAKALALRAGLAYVAVPTTYAGSEMTPIWGLTDGGEKTTGRDQTVRPKAVCYDPDLTLSLPVSLSVTSGLNAVAHAVEALYAPDGSPMISLMAGEGIRAILDALPTIVAAPTDHPARAGALYGAWLCGACLGATTMSLHHKLCHTLGGAFNLPHAEMHSVLLPYSMAYNLRGAPQARSVLCDVLGGDDPARTLWELAGGLGAPRSLRGIGMPEDGIDQAVGLALRNQYANPVPVTGDGVRNLLTLALDGAAPPEGG